MKNILYVFDDINYESGAQKVTLFQIKKLSIEYNITILSLTKPNSEIISTYSEFTFIEEGIWKRTRCLNESLKSVLFKKEYLLIEKIKRMLYSFLNHIQLQTLSVKMFIPKKVRKKLKKI